MKYRVTIDVKVGEDMGWDETSLYELYDEAASSYGDFSATVKVEKVVPPKKVNCPCCQKPVSHVDEHYDDLDGPNRAGYTCPRY